MRGCYITQRKLLYSNEVSKISYFISLSLIYLNSLASVIRSRQRPVKWLLLLFMWILFWGNYGNADYSGYLYFYRLSLTRSVFEMPFGFVFSALMKCFSILGLDYNKFLLGISLVAFVLIIYTTEEISPKPEFVYVLYFLYPFLMDIVQIRQFLSMSIVFYSMRYLFSSNERNNIKYFVGITLASSVHIAAAPMMIMLITRKASRISLFLVTASVAFIGSVLANTGSLSKYITFFFPPEKVGYLATRIRFGWILIFGIQLVFFSLALYSSRILSRTEKGYLYRVSDIICKANIIMIAMLPLYFINSNFYRFYRFMLLPNYLIYSFALVRSRKRALFLLLFLFLVAAIGIWEIIVVHQYGVFVPIMENNLIFDIFR